MTATGVLPAGGLCDVHVVELAALASNLTAHFNVEQAPARYALHVWTYHLLGGQEARFEAPTGDRRAAVTGCIGKRCEAIAKAHDKRKSAKTKLLRLAEKGGDAAVISAARAVLQEIVCSTSKDGVNELYANVPIQPTGRKRPAEQGTDAKAKRLRELGPPTPHLQASHLQAEPRVDQEMGDSSDPPPAPAPAEPAPPAPPVARQQQPGSSRRSEQPCPMCGEIRAYRLDERECVQRLEAELQSVKRQLEQAARNHSAWSAQLINAEQKEREQLRAAEEKRRTKLAAEVRRLSEQVHAQQELRQRADDAKVAAESAARDVRKAEHATQALQHLLDRAHSEIRLAEGKVGRLEATVRALERLGCGEAAAELAEMRQRADAAEEAQVLAEAAQQAAEKRASSLNTEVIALRAQLKRTARSADAASGAAEASAAELDAYRADMRQRVAADGESWSVSSAEAAGKLLADEQLRSEIERAIIVEELTSRYDLPEARIYDSKAHE